MRRRRAASTFATAVAALGASLALAACGGSGGGSPINTADATTFWRQQVGQHYGGSVPTDDGRGCAEINPRRYSCTAYVRNPSHDIDVVGTVTVQGGGGGTMTVDAHQVSSGNGGAIARWFQQTGGGCPTSSCAGTHLR